MRLFCRLIDLPADDPVVLAISLSLTPYLFPSPTPPISFVCLSNAQFFHASSLPRDKICAPSSASIRLPSIRLRNYRGPSRRGGHRIDREDVNDK